MKSVGKGFEEGFFSQSIDFEMESKGEIVHSKTFNSIKQRNESQSYFCEFTNVIKSENFSLSVRTHKIHGGTYHCLSICSPKVPKVRNNYFYPGNQSLGWAFWDQGWLNFPQYFPNSKLGKYNSSYFYFGEKSLFLKNGKNALENGDTITFFVNKRKKTIEIELDKHDQFENYPFMKNKRFLIYGGEEQKEIMAKETPPIIPTELNKHLWDAIRSWPEEGLCLCVSGYVNYEADFEIVGFRDFDQKKDEDLKERIEFLFDESKIEEILDNSKLLKTIQLKHQETALSFLSMI